MNNKKKKGRQGRSRAVRERVRAERERQKREQEGIYRSVLRCSDPWCIGDSYSQVYDHCSGDTICTLCGRVVEESGTGAPENIGIGFQLRLLSKPYDRLVHFQQRIAQLTCRDPALPRWFLRTLAEYVGSSRPELEAMLEVPAERWGIRCFKRIIEGQCLLNWMSMDPKPKRRQLPNSPSKLAIHWLQIRKSLGIEPWQVELDCQTLDFMRRRYRLVSLAFDETLRRPTSEQSRLPIHDIVAPLSRKNIINVNYSMAQLLRIVNPPLWRKLARFIPQLESQNQPSQNNQRWEILMAFCRLNFHHQADMAEPLEWPYQPLSESDLKLYFNFFDNNE